MSQQPYQRSAIDEKQQAFAKRKRNQDEARQRDALRAMLHDRNGRTVLHALLEQSGREGAIVGDTDAETLRKAAVHDFGSELLERLREADARAVELMDREHQQYVRMRNDESEAMEADAERRAQDDEGE